MFLSSEFDRNIRIRKYERTGCAKLLLFLISLSQVPTQRLGFHSSFTFPMIVFHTAVSSNKRARGPAIHTFKGICDMIATLSWIGIPQKRTHSFN